MQLKVDNFSKGWMSDAALDRDKIYSFKSFINSDIEYERGASIRRPGYNRHHSVSLTGTPKQFYSFTNLSGETRELVISYDDTAVAHYHLFVIVNGTAYEIRNYSTSPTSILTFDSHDSYPFVTIKDRICYADDNDWYWSDYSSLVSGAGPYTYECYQMGIDKPTDVNTGLQTRTTYGYEDAVDGFQLLGDIGIGGTYVRIGQSCILATNLIIDAVRLWVQKYDFVSSAASVTLNIYPDSGGEPDETNSLASSRLDLGDVIVGPTLIYTGWLRWPFDEKITLTSGTTYWIVIEGDTSYKTLTITDGYLAWRSNNGYGMGKAMYYDTVWNDFAPAIDMLFQLGGQLEKDKSYRYKYSFYNDIHGIESPPAEEHQTGFDMTVNTTDAEATYDLSNKTTVTITNLPQSDDTQITHVRVYRTKADAVSPSDYYLVNDVASGTTTYIDCVADENLGAELQTGGDLVSAKHIRLADADGNLIVPRFIDIWNGRLWTVENDSNVLNFSKLLEHAGATGVAGDSIYDYFPADNKWSLDSRIRAIRKRGENEFVVYTSNNNVHVFRGGDNILNPPPDLSKQEMVVGSNCLDDRTLCEIRGRHIFVTTDKEIKSFNGTVDLEEIGEGVTSHMLLTGDKFSAVIYKNQYYLGVDTNGDDVLDSIFILDLSRPALTNWRSYQYLNSDDETMTFYNLFVTNDGRIFTCPDDLDSSDYYVVQLDTGYSDDWTTEYDDGVNITRVIQTQSIIPARRARWSKLVLSAFYPHGMFYGTGFFDGGTYDGAETIPTYNIYALGKSDEFRQTSISPSSSRDIRGHTVGLRLLSEECSIRIEDTGNKKDEIRSLTLHWSFN